MSTQESTGLRRVSLCATLALTSHAEYAAGVAAGLPLWHPWGNGANDGLAIGLPWLLPVAIDCYVVDALERRGGMDQIAAIVILALSVIGGSAYVAANLTEGLKAAGVGAVLVFVLARLYSAAKPSKADLAAESTAQSARRAEEVRRVHAEEQRQREASRLRIEEAEHLARVDAARVRADAEAAGLRIQAESAAEAQRIQAAADADVARKRASAESAAAEAERIRVASAADVARIHAEAEAKRPRRPAQASADGPRTVRGQSAAQSADGPRTVREKASADAPAESVDAPSKEDAIRMVASAIRAHRGPEPYVFEWRTWSAQYGGGRSFWFGVKQTAEQRPHLAQSATG